MKVLFLDDDRVRTRHFRRAMIGHDIVTVETADAAIAQLKAREFDLISLDHDLGGNTFVPSEEHNTGYTVAKELAARNSKIPIIIHSYNPIGAKRMADKLSAPHVPFATPQYWKIFGLAEMPDYVVSLLQYRDAA